MSYFLIKFFSNTNYRKRREKERMREEGGKKENVKGTVKKVENGRKVGRPHSDLLNLTLNWERSGGGWPG